MVYQLIYTSRTRSNIDQRVMEQVAYLSSGRNETENVTGILIYCENVIVQVLEGDELNVLKVYNKICRDTRHFEVCVLGEGQVHRREFPGMPMGFKVVTSDEKKQLVSVLVDDSPLLAPPGVQRMFA